MGVRHGNVLSRTAAPAIVMVLVLAPDASSQPASVLGYVNWIPPEAADARAARHRKVAERRQGTPILVHRGAHRLAPENTIEACAAAMDHGADGIEIDIRRSTDGVLYLFHDDTLDRMTDGAGPVKGRTYYELLQQRFRSSGTTKTAPRVPTLAAVLVLARQRSALLHLDVKEREIEEDIIRLFDAADVWDHVVQINSYNSEKLRRQFKVKPLSYKGWFPDGKQADEPAVVKEFLAKPGVMVFCEDPHAAARALNRTSTFMPLPEGLRVEWTPRSPATSRATETAPAGRAETGGAGDARKPSIGR